MHAPTHAPWPRHPIRAWLGATALVLALAACSGGAAAPAVPTAPASSPGTGPQASGDGQASPGASLSPEDAMLAYTKCMREHGVDMPDPQFVGGGGSTSGGAAIQISGDPLSPAFNDATKACDPLLPRMGSSGDGQVAQEFADQALKMARCMRDHGIDMPDPQFGDGGSVSIGVAGDGIDPNSTKFQDAAKACGMGDGTTITVGGGSVTPSDQP